MPQSRVFYFYGSRMLEESGVLKENHLPSASSIANSLTPRISHSMNEMINFMEVWWRSTGVLIEKPILGIRTDKQTSLCQNLQDWDLKYFLIYLDCM